MATDERLTHLESHGSTPWVGVPIRGNQTMKQINETVTDGEHERLTDVKGDRTWREAILEEFGVGE